MASGSSKDKSQSSILENFDILLKEHRETFENIAIIGLGEKEKDRIRKEEKLGKYKEEPTEI